MTPHPPDDLNDERLVRYLSGDCSPAEARAIERWIDQSAERRQRVDLLRRGWAAAGGVALRGDVEKGWAAIAPQLEDAASSDSEPDHPPRVLRLVPAAPRRALWIVAARAAGIVLVAGTAARLVQLAGREGETSRLGAQASVMREITTKPGQRADVYLSDGTHVVLGVASSLRFPATFGATRDVELHGQAYFDVVHDETRPFAVHTARAVARDLGTRFDVRAYADTEDVAVVVTEGAVVLKPTGGATAPAGVRADSVVLGPTDMGRVSPDGQLAALRAVDTAAYVGWTAGRLVFQQTPVSEAISQLNRWYDADVRLGDSTLAGLALTVSVRNESLTQALDIVASALDARVERRGSSVILYASHTR